MDKTLSLQYKGCKFDPGWVTKIPACRGAKTNQTKNPKLYITLKTDMGFKCFKIINDPNLENNLCLLEPNAQKRRKMIQKITIFTFIKENIFLFTLLLQWKITGNLGKTIMLYIKAIGLYWWMSWDIKKKFLIWKAYCYKAK